MMNKQLAIALAIVGLGTLFAILLVVSSFLKNKHGYN